MAQRNNGYKNKPRPSPYSSNNWKDRKHTQDETDLSSSSYSQDSQQNFIDSSAANDDNITYPSSGQQPLVEEYQKEKKFGNRARLYVGNLPRLITEDELLNLFKPYGEIKQVYIEKDKNFGFVRMAYRKQSEQAITSLNGSDFKGRELRVRFAASSCSVRVDNINPTVSNELLHQAFSQFGEVEYAVVVTDERGKSLGYGVVDFGKKSQAITAIERCRQGCFFLTRSPIPVSLSELVRENEDDGLRERQIIKTSQYNYEREVPPRMAHPSSSEYNYGMRYKELYDAEKRQKEEIEAHYSEARKQLESEMQQHKHQEHATVLRQQLAEYQKEQVKIQQRLQKHEAKYLPHPPHQLPPTMMSANSLVPPPIPVGTSAHMMHVPLMPQGMLAPPPPILPPQPLMPVINANQGALATPPPVPPPFLLPSPAGQQLPPPS